MKIITIVTAFAALATTTALVVPTVASAQAVETAAIATPAPEAGQEGAQAKICLNHAPLGSRVPRKMCQTREQWAQQGVDTDKQGK